MVDRRAQASGLCYGSGVALLAALLFALTARPAMSAEAVALGYEGYLGGLHLLSAEVELVSDDSSYRMVTRATGTGLFGWLLAWRSTAVTEGVVNPDGSLRPLRHSREIAQRGRNPKALEIEYREDGVPLVARMRVGDEAKFRPAKKRRNTIDPLSAVTAIIDQMAAGAPCKGAFPVFDGKLRYDVTAKPGEPMQLAGNRYTMFSGQASVCILVLKAIDGFDDEEELGNPRERAAEPDDETLDLTMWFASPGEGLPTVPVRASADTDYGGLRLYLARAGELVVQPGEKRAEAR